MKRWQKPPRDESSGFRQALADLAEIGAFIAQDDPRAADRFLRELKESCRSLSDQPHRYPVLPERPDSGFRRRPHGAYQIFYRVGSDAVEVVRILHGARDQVAILFRKP